MSLATWAVLALSSGLAIWPGATPPVAPAHRPAPVAAPTPAQLDEAVSRGVAFLVKDQNPDGSWGSPTRTKGLNLLTPVPYGHDAYRAAVTALCVSALIEVGGGTPDSRVASERGEAWLLKNLPELRRSSTDVLYNIWGHVYGIQALVRMHRETADVARKRHIEDVIRGQIDLLVRYESVDGGWGYYDFSIGAQRPASMTASFMSAAGLVALDEAKQVGIAPPERLVRTTLASIRRQRKPDFSYLYGEYLRWRPMMPVNQPGGSLGRSQACNVALRLWGDAAVTDAVIKQCLDRLFARHLWLDMGRKRPIPHESHFQVAGYFFYFGHYYAALCIERLPTVDRPPYQDQLARVLVDRQEADGSWWDYPLYNYHQQYGTAFALMSLGRCRHSQTKASR